MEVKKCGVTKTISPPTIKQEPAEETSQPMLPDSSSDRGSTTSTSHKRGNGARVKMEHLEVKQEPGTWDGEVSGRDFHFIMWWMIDISSDENGVDAIVIVEPRCAPATNL